ncbi:enhanced serine sensitivity protein SseB C-terminal domain-containing protein [Kitasatospora sp. CM 4170]|uniref:Enhanced serine sensitivity protein SseB C-terminal domain-containing protein n=1 Tax=Kitasatospora aburaviensis TaxID=67265 RepID=A0ABW1F472_9ACTN|nr:enhanced serine sensitivity protein SseB C-terminal domain-containing protein [Kitasatospora sp. CM 4170]WNM47766.1 enhanced serine sensitivity protein SseB C-terminal domain-containing protein [Kitasatospora sp. CM 4170]
MGYPVEQQQGWGGPESAPPGGGWPANELEQVLTAALGDPGATPRVIEVLARSQVWIPLPAGADPQGQALDLPTIELAGDPYVPVFSSQEVFLQQAPGMPFAIAPVWEFARGLPLGVGIAVNPEAAVGIPVPPQGVAELRRGPRDDRWEAPDAPTGGRVALREPVPGEDPEAFLAACRSELSALPGVLTARRALASVEGEPTVMFVGVQLDPAAPADPAAVNGALGRALGTAPLPGGVHLVLLDLAEDPVVEWLLNRVQPFYTRM